MVAIYIAVLIGLALLVYHQVIAHPTTEGREVADGAKVTKFVIPRGEDGKPTALKRTEKDARGNKVEVRYYIGELPGDRDKNVFPMLYIIQAETLEPEKDGDLWILYAIKLAEPTPGGTYWTATTPSK